jgi:tRNA1(Val) A37 N6-methylase TrmN6
MQMTGAQVSPAPELDPLPASLTEDAFLGGRLKILQPKKGFRAGIDSVLLAASIPCHEGEALFEAGIGAGVAALCVAARVPAVHVTGVEIAAGYATMAEQNVRRNGFEGSIRVVHGDVKDALRRDLVDRAGHGSYSHAFANPPYFEDGTMTPSPDILKATATRFAPDDIELWLKVLNVMLAPGGTATVIHRSQSLGRLLAAMQGRFGDIVVAPVHGRDDMTASRVVVQGVKGSRGPLRILPGLVLHGSEARFTPRAERLLRDGQPWCLRG